MSVIYLKHPQHGTKVATTDEEADADKKRGWEKFDPTVPEKKQPKLQQEAQPI